MGAPPCDNESSAGVGRHDAGGCGSSGPGECGALLEVERRHVDCHGRLTQLAFLVPRVHEQQDVTKVNAAIPGHTQLDLAGVGEYYITHEKVLHCTRESTTLHTRKYYITHEKVLHYTRESTILHTRNYYYGISPSNTRKYYIHHTYESTISFTRRYHITHKKLLYCT